MATKIIKKNGKYYRLDDKGQQHEVELKDGYFTWTTADKVKYRAKAEGSFTDKSLETKPKVATKRQASIYRTRQRFLNQNGYKVKEDGSWGPWQESLYRQAIAEVS